VGLDHLIASRRDRVIASGRRALRAERWFGPTREYRRGGSPAGLYTFRRTDLLLMGQRSRSPRRRLGSGSPARDGSRGRGSPNSPGSPRPVSGAGPSSWRKPLLYPAELRAL